MQIIIIHQLLTIQMEASPRWTSRARETTKDLRCSDKPTRLMPLTVQSKWEAPNLIHTFNIAPLVWQAHNATTPRKSVGQIGGALKPSPSKTNIIPLTSK